MNTSWNQGLPVRGSLPVKSELVLSRLSAVGTSAAEMMKGAPR